MRSGTPEKKILFPTVVVGRRLRRVRRLRHHGFSVAFVLLQILSLFVVYSLLHADFKFRVSVQLDVQRCCRTNVPRCCLEPHGLDLAVADGGVAIDL
jgi:hypothetical protein